MKILPVLFSALATTFISTSNASDIKFNDLQDTISVTVDGTPLTGGNISWITNFNLNGENVSFDVSTDGNNFQSKTGYTTLWETVSGGGGVESDRIVITSTLGAATYHVEFGSDPSLPAIPGGAIDLTTLASQGLPNGPILETGDYQKLATVFNANGSVLDTYYAVSDVPIPAAIWLSGSALAGLFGFARRRKALGA